MFVLTFIQFTTFKCDIQTDGTITVNGVTHAGEKKVHTPQHGIRDVISEINMYIHLSEITSRTSCCGHEVFSPPNESDGSICLNITSKRCRLNSVNTKNSINCNPSDFDNRKVVLRLCFQSINVPVVAFVEEH